MDILHVIFWTALGMGCQYALPQFPVVGTLAVSAGWHQARSDWHDPFEVRMETMTAVAGSELIRSIR